MNRQVGIVPGKVTFICAAVTQVKALASSTRHPMHNHDTQRQALFEKTENKTATSAKARGRKGVTVGLGWRSCGRALQAMVGMRMRPRSPVHRAGHSRARLSGPSECGEGHPGVEESRHSSESTLTPVTGWGGVAVETEATQFGEEPSWQGSCGRGMSLICL